MDTNTFSAQVSDLTPAAAGAATRPASVLICGAPGDGTLILGDWLLLALRNRGVSAEVATVGGRLDQPHGLYIEFAAAGETENHLSDIPAGSVDLLVAGEHIELVRALGHGFADPARTTIISTCRRSLTPLERAVAGHYLPRERDIDLAAEAAAARYVAFDSQEVAGWYRLPSHSHSALLLGAVCGAGMFGLELRDGERAVRQLGIDVDANLRALQFGVRFGRQSGGRIRRTTNASQFVRKTRGSLPRRERPGFEQQIQRIQDQFDPLHGAVLQQAVYALCDFESAAYAGRLLDLCESVATDERSASIDVQAPTADSLVPIVARNLASMLAYPDAAYIAQIKLRPKRLPKLRKLHGVTRRDVYELHDHLPPEAARLKQHLGSGRTPRPEALLLDPAAAATVHTTSLRGALRLRLLRGTARWRTSRPQHAREFDTAELYVTTVREALRVDVELARMIAESGALFQGTGAAREGSRAGVMAFWGHVVRASFAIDQNGGDAQYSFTRQVVPHVYEQICRYGLVELWELAGSVTNLALHQARGATHAEAVAIARSAFTR